MDRDGISADNFMITMISKDVLCISEVSIDITSLNSSCVKRSISLKMASANTWKEREPSYLDSRSAHRCCESLSQKIILSHIP